MRFIFASILSLPLSGCPAGAQPCSALPPGLERDKCGYREVMVLGPEAAEQVLAKAADIADPIVATRR